MEQTSRSARVLQDPPFALGISRSKREQADVDVNRRTGVLPHNLCRCSFYGLMLTITTPWLGTAAEKLPVCSPIS